MAKLNFERLIPLFEANEEFSLTESQYQKSVGKSLPKDYYYLKNKSALANEAKNTDTVLKLKKKLYV